MLGLKWEPSDAQYRIKLPPKWVPIVKGKENVLVANGWSVLDPDENELLSAFDIDAVPMSKASIGRAGETQVTRVKRIFMNPWNPFLHWNFLSGNVPLQKLEEKLFVWMSFQERSCWRDQRIRRSERLLTMRTTLQVLRVSQIWNVVSFPAIGGPPLFTTLDLSPITASSGWLSFSQPLSNDHVVMVEPEVDSPDQRTEVLYAKTKCHLGHYFGKENGYCINASALNFVGSNSHSNSASPQQSNTPVALPVSWRALEAHTNESSSLQHLHCICINAASIET